jgi:hypothetical protein
MPCGIILLWGVIMPQRIILPRPIDLVSQNEMSLEQVIFSDDLINFISQATGWT